MENALVYERASWLAASQRRGWISNRLLGIVPCPIGVLICPSAEASERCWVLGAEFRDGDQMHETTPLEDT